VDEPRKHVLRAGFPWRAEHDLDSPGHAGVLLECGRDLKPGAPVMTHAEFAVMLKDYGPQRTSLFVCMTCMDTASRHAGITWDADPVRMIGREIDRWGRTTGQFRDELYALGELYRRHPDEFAVIMASFAATVRLDTRRTRRTSTA
jgi:hypothetical protein